MPEYHKVAPGECISSIADKHGFFWETLWNDANNADLKQLREDPNTLVPGDQVYIPDLREKNEARNTGALHKFKKRGIPAQLRVQLLDGDEPRANQSYVLVIDEQHFHRGETDANGLLKVPIAPDARMAHLTIGPDEAEYELSLGHLPPIDTLDGVQARLQNLGFLDGKLSGELDPATQAALKAFQDRCDLETSGEIDDATRDRLEQIHDGDEALPEDGDDPENEERVEQASLDDAY